MNDHFTILFWHWWIIAAILLVIEITAPLTYFLWLAVAATLTGIAAWIFPALSLGTQFIIFSVLAIASIIAAKLLLKRRPIHTEQPQLNQRGQRLIGTTVELVEAIEAGYGKARLGDTVWRVSGKDMPAGTQVKVVGIEGATLQIAIKD